MKDLDTELDELFDTELEEYEQEHSSSGCSCKQRTAETELGWQPPPKPVNVDCPAPGKPFELLDQFAFNSAALNAARHTPRIARVVRTIVASQRTSGPIRTVLISGHTDPAGNDNYNFLLGRRRAEEVLRALRAQLDRASPGLSARITFQVTTCGERQPKATAPESRRVEIFFPKRRRVQPPVPYGDECSASAPRTPMEFELDELETSRPRQRPLKSRRTKPTVTVEPILSLFQNHEIDRHHFECAAGNQAKDANAFALRSPKDCTPRRGPTPYDTGEDIIQAIVATEACLKRPVKTIHIFGHGTARGIAGRGKSMVGLYRNTRIPTIDRALGGRTISDIPTAPLADDVTFVLHSCMSAGDTDFDGAALKVENLAKQLYEHLKAKLKNPKVYGHHTKGCSGRNCEWRVYSNTFPNGLDLTKVPGVTKKHCCKVADLPKSCRP